MSYDEHLITNTGGDDDPVTITAADAQTVIKALRFYAEHPEYNDDTETATDALARIKMATSSAYGKRPRTEDYTPTELFGTIGSYVWMKEGLTCSECGAMVAAVHTHTAWHNKLLP